MLTYGYKKTKVVAAMKCDSCGFETDDVMEMQEFLSYHDQAGYGAKRFHDMDSLDLDLCEMCKFELLGKYMRVTAYRDYNDSNEWKTYSSDSDDEEGD